MGNCIRNFISTSIRMDDNFFKEYKSQRCVRHLACTLKRVSCGKKLSHFLLGMIDIVCCTEDSSSFLSHAAHLLQVFKL